jgi:hypothetical protein
MEDEELDEKMRRQATFHLEAFFAADGVSENASFNPAGDPGAMETLKAVSVVFGIDVMAQNPFLLFGRKALKAAKGDEKFSTLFIELDQDSNELQRAIELVERVKGRHDFIGIDNTGIPEGGDERKEDE